MGEGNRRAKIPPPLLHIHQGDKVADRIHGKLLVPEVYLKGATYLLQQEEEEEEEEKS